MKKENRQMAQERRAQERKRKEQKEKAKKFLMIGLPILIVALFIAVIFVCGGGAIRCIFMYIFMRAVPAWNPFLIVFFY